MKRTRFLPCWCTPRTRPRASPRSDPPRTSPPWSGWRSTGPAEWSASVEPLWCRRLIQDYPSTHCSARSLWSCWRRMLASCNETSALMYTVYTTDAMAGLSLSPTCKYTRDDEWRWDRVPRKINSKLFILCLAIFFSIFLHFKIRISNSNLGITVCFQTPNHNHECDRELKQDCHIVRFILWDLISRIAHVVGRIG